MGKSWKKSSFEDDEMDIDEDFIAKRTRDRVVEQHRKMKEMMLSQVLEDDNAKLHIQK
jgi:hypothetical protein